MREEAREFAWDYLSRNPCVDCGESDPRVLEFDHVKGKNADGSRLIADGVPLDRLRREIGLTDMRCANCHRKKTASERGWFRGV